MRLSQLAAAAVVALGIAAAPPAQAIVSYELSFTGAVLHDYTQGGIDIGFYDGGFLVETAAPIDAAGLYPTSSCFLSANADALYDCAPTQHFEPFLGTGQNFIGFSTVNDDGSGSGEGFLFFPLGSFLTNGVHSLYTGDLGGLFGNFATSATLTVRGIGDPVTDTPEPASLALLGIGLLGLAARRRG